MQVVLSRERPGRHRQCVALDWKKGRWLTSRLRSLECIWSFAGSSQGMFGLIKHLFPPMAFHFHAKFSLALDLPCPRVSLSLTDLLVLRRPIEPSKPHCPARHPATSTQTNASPQSPYSISISRIQLKTPNPNFFYLSRVFISMPAKSFSTL